MKTLNLAITIITLLLFSCNSEIANELDNNINNLQFNQILEFENNYLEGVSLGMANSSNDNSLYISSRDDYNPLEAGSNREQIIKVNLDNNTFTEYVYNKSDFITKRLIVSNDQLISFGGQFVNKYEMDINSEPATIAHQRLFSRHKIAKKDETTFFIIGGDLTMINSDKIYQWNPNDPQTFVELTSLSTPIYNADGIVANDKLYVFGGYSDSNLTTPLNKIFIIPLLTPNDIQEISMDIPINETFVERYNENLIVAGMDDLGNPIIAKFNLENESLAIIEHNLTEINPDYKIGQMTLLNDKLYLVYGFAEPLTPPPGLNSNWLILETNLN